jgi:catechol 2,3-dioxygenase-like lactoylglutathione lyase family enzyme
MAIEVTAHHMSFPVSDLDKSRAFYEGVLGLKAIPRPNFPFPGMWYQAGPCEVHLIQTPPGADVGTPPAANNPMGRHAAFGIRDYAETLAHLQRHGLDVLATSPEVGQMWVKDPDGHVIELIVDRRR